MVATLTDSASGGRHFVSKLCAGISDKKTHDEVAFRVIRIRNTLSREFCFFWSLSVVRQNILISVMLCVGLKGLRLYDDFLVSLENGDYEEAAIHMRIAAMQGNGGVIMRMSANDMIRG